MLKIGQYQELEIIKTVDFGAYLDGGPYGEILIPSKYLPEQFEIGDEIEVFIYCDTEDRLIATTEKPYAIVGDFAYLEAKAVNNVGAFLDWGLTKDLFVPFREQGKKMVEGQRYLVKIFIDEATERIVASTRLNRFLEVENESFIPGDEVDLVIAKATDLGFKVIINNLYWGLVFKNEVFTSLEIGDRVTGYIKAIREDKRIDVSLRKQGFVNQNPSDTQQILNRLESSNGFIALTDKSDPALIYSELSMSKKAFKRAVGSLYKQKLIKLETDGVYLAKTE